MTTGDTKERILDAAETLFAEKGFAGTSLRTITRAAGVNLAAVNYHFGSKEALIDAVYARRLEPLNRERLARLDACEAETGEAAPPLERILEAFVGPPLRLRRNPAGGQHCMRLLGRLYTEPDERLRAFIFEQFAEIKRRFGAAFQRALPHLPAAELFWRMHFVIGALAQTMADPQRLEVLSGGLCDPHDVEGTLDRLIPFLAAGLRAAAPAPEGSA